MINVYKMDLMCLLNFLQEEWLLVLKKLGITKNTLWYFNLLELRNIIYYVMKWCLPWWWNGAWNIRCMSCFFLLLPIVLLLLCYGVFSLRLWHMEYATNEVNEYGPQKPLLMMITYAST